MINLRQFFNLTYYTSQLDEFLTKFNKSHPQLSVSQRIEQEKYARIYALRDIPGQPTPEKKFWDNF